jgi:hypothetical protein
MKKRRETTATEREQRMANKNEEIDKGVKEKLKIKRREEKEPETG